MADNGQARETAERIARRHYGKLVAFLAARTGDVAGAEDALSDAFAAALLDWPKSGVPQIPEAWLLTAARRRIIDMNRRKATGEKGASHLELIARELRALEINADRTQIPDERLRLMFACAHPAIDPAIRAPLILQTVLGFDAVAIGSAFLISPAAMGKRLVRAKSKIGQARIPFRIPERTEMHERLDSVLEAIYAVFAEGWSEPTGTDVRRREWTEEGIWLGRLVISLLPDEPEALGLLALMLYAESRRRARRSPDGRYVPLQEQDTALWDEALIDEAETLLRKASAIQMTGRYQLEAALQSAHVVRRKTGRADWAAIERIYDALFAVTGSPVVAVNRAVALAQTRGAAAWLKALDALAKEEKLADYQPYWAARADLFAQLGNISAAGEAYCRAIGLERDSAVRAFLQEQQAALSVLAKKT